MKISIKPTSVMLVGILFICIFSVPASAEKQSDGLEQLNKFKEHSFYSRHQEMSPDLGILKVGEDAIHFPWYRKTLPMRPALSGSITTSSKKEEILMDSSNPTASVGDLSSINSLNERDLHYKDSQNGDPMYGGLVNSQDIIVGSKDNDSVDNGSNKSFVDDNKSSADEFTNSNMQEAGIAGRGFEDCDIHQAGNYLSIDVHDISVSAINTIKGGSAVATSNIIIEPVQIIICPSEVEEKLR